jgi:hypothetical protein
LLIAALRAVFSPTEAVFAFVSPSTNRAEIVVVSYEIVIVSYEIAVVSYEIASVNQWAMSNGAAKPPMSNGAAKPPMSN